MPGMEESLFSLELGIGKLYIPHVSCRFPAVAFRLLDFPTILINHVEDELGRSIRRQISFDSDFQLPEQFSELKDKHGNYMVKKGKSCLFKMATETLKYHLSNTPLYVMVIDTFPEVPKLVGNSTVSLNMVIDAICADIARYGPTVPSAHGDKGLFKVYNLMGKEIGYFVLGFRLLCLGPGLIPHLPDAVLAQRQNTKNKIHQQNENIQMVKMMQLSQGQDTPEDVVKTTTTGYMADTIKKDIMVQTVEIDPKEVYVDIHAPHRAGRQHNTERAIQHSGTQTDKNGIKTTFSARQKILEAVSALEDENSKDEIIITNIVCPPPLFFNTNAKPPVKVEDDLYSLDTDMSMLDDISVDSFTDKEAENKRTTLAGKSKLPRKESSFIDKSQIITPPVPCSYEDVPFNALTASQPQQKASSSRNSNSVHVLPSFIQLLGDGFPVLSTLLTELVCFQNPEFRNKLVQQAPQVQSSSGQLSEVGKQPDISQTAIVAGVPSIQKLEEIHVNSNTEASQKKNAHDKDVFLPVRRGHLKCAHPHTGVPKDKSWLRIIPECNKKKSRLTFGLTNTQRLRLQKTNPAWLKSMERAASKGITNHSCIHDKSGDVLNFSRVCDTLTEVQRQAQRELDKTIANDILTTGSKLHSSADISKSKKAKISNRTPSQHNQSVASRKTMQTPASKPCNPKVSASQSSTSFELCNDELKEPASPQSYPLDQVVKNIMSPDYDLVSSTATGDLKEILQANAKSIHQQSSANNRSIEVHLPKIHSGHELVSDATDTEEEDDIPLPDDSFNQLDHAGQPLNFPTYLKQIEILPESINGQPNISLNTTSGLVENSPLESTHNYNPEARNLQSMDDFDAKQTFHSTSEPELQGLVSEEELGQVESNEKKFPVIIPILSENSPVPSTRRSVAKLDVSKGHLPATPWGETTTSVSSSSGSPRRPTPQPRDHHRVRDFKESVHTDSVSSYMPSDSESMVSLSSGERNYSDFLGDAPERPRIIPSTKLGYSIH